MRRTIITRGDGGGERSLREGQPLEATDGYIAKLLKYIPTEVIALYVFCGTVLQSSDTVPQAAHWVVFVFCLVATPVYLWRVQKVHKRLQLALSTGAFFVWVLALGEPFTFLSWYQPWIGGLVLPCYTFSIGLVDP